MPGAWVEGGSVGRPGQARIARGAWIHCGWQSPNESMSLDSRMHLKVCRGVEECVLSLLMTPGVGKIHPTGEGGARQSATMSQGGIQKPESGFALGEQLAFCAHDGRTAVPKDLAAVIARVPYFGRAGCPGEASWGPFQEHEGRVLQGTFWSGLSRPWVPGGQEMGHWGRAE